MEKITNSSSVALRNWPPGFRFNPTPIELFKEYYWERATKGFCKWGGVIWERIDILAFQPQHLPGMDPETHEAYYFYEREKKSSAAGAKRNNRVITGTTGGFWRKSTKPERIVEITTGPAGGQEKKVWGTKTMLNHYSAPKTRTDWLMTEYELDPSFEKIGGDLVLCKIYRKKGGDESSSSSSAAAAADNGIPYGFSTEENSDTTPPPKRRKVSAEDPITTIPQIETFNDDSSQLLQTESTCLPPLIEYEETDFSNLMELTDVNWEEYGDLMELLDVETEVDLQDWDLEYNAPIPATT